MAYDVGPMLIFIKSSTNPVLSSLSCSSGFPNARRKEREHTKKLWKKRGIIKSFGPQSNQLQKGLI